jgi:hypothetical protein
MKKELMEEGINTNKTSGMGRRTSLWQFCWCGKCRNYRVSTHPARPRNSRLTFAQSDPAFVAPAPERGILRALWWLGYSTLEIPMKQSKNQEYHKLLWYPSVHGPCG